jgi:hypothetical protein
VALFFLFLHNSKSVTMSQKVRYRELPMSGPTWCPTCFFYYYSTVIMSQNGGILTDPVIDPAVSGQNGRDPPGSGRIRPLIRPDPEDSGLNPAILAGSGQTFSPESGNGDQTLPNSGNNYQTFIFAFRNFFVRTKHRKIFSRKSFFLKMISSKSFYVETNGALVSRKIIAHTL